MNETSSSSSVSSRLSSSLTPADAVAPGDNDDVDNSNPNLSGDASRASGSSKHAMRRMSADSNKPKTKGTTKSARDGSSSGSGTKTKKTSTESDGTKENKRWNREDEEQHPDNLDHSNKDHSRNTNNNVVIIKTTEEKLRETERLIATEIYNTNVVPDTMATWCAAFSFFQITQALILFFLAISEADEHLWFWFVSYPNPSRSNIDRGSCSCLETGKAFWDLDDASKVPEVKNIASFSILWLIPLIPLFSGIQHLCTIVFRERYTYYIERHQNPFRWTEYTISASLMKVIIAQQVGMTDVHLLISTFVLMAITIQCGAAHEAMNAKARSEDRRQYWGSFFISWIGHLAIWAMIINYASVTTSRRSTNVEEDEEDASAQYNAGSVWSLLWIQFWLDSSFAILFTLQWKKIGFAKDYVVAEKAFLALSFVAKTTLCWITVTNVLG